MRFKISEHFRQSMGWFHTWLGVAFSAVLFAIFWTGTLTVFDKEIDQWMKPELRLIEPSGISLDTMVLPFLKQLDLAPESTVWIGMPRERIPVVRLFYDDASGASHEELLNPNTGSLLDVTDSDAGSEFLFHFHYMLHMPGILGYYIVGISALAMMALIISGIFVHRKVFQEFFTFRPEKKSRRVVLDMHNLTGLIALPFHFIIPFSGLLILISSYFPWSMALPFGGDLHTLDAQLSAYESGLIKAAGQPAAFADHLDEYLHRANAQWREEEGENTSTADWLAIFNVYDAKSYVVVERFFANKRVALGPDQVVFDIANGEKIDQFKPLPIHAASNWLEGLHWIQFDHWLLRWLYFFTGLSGCVMIGSGFIFWLQSRVKKLQAEATHVRFVRALSIAAITGIMLATAAFFIANRLIPRDISLDIARQDLEIWAFFLTWLLSLLHAGVRDKAAWHEQCFMLAASYPLAALLNAITTGDHLIASIRQSLWAVALMDILMLLTGVLAAIAAIRLQLLNKQCYKPELPMGQ